MFDLPAHCWWQLQNYYYISHFSRMTLLLVTCMTHPHRRYFRVAAPVHVLDYDIQLPIPGIDIYEK